MNKKSRYCYIEKIFKGSLAKDWQCRRSQAISDLIARNFLIRKLKKVIKNKKVLDFGCGEGYITRQISNNAQIVVGIDKSKDMI